MVIVITKPYRPARGSRVLSAARASPPVHYGRRLLSVDIRVYIYIYIYIYTCMYIHIQYIYLSIYLSLSLSIYIYIYICKLRPSTAQRGRRLNFTPIIYYTILCFTILYLYYTYNYNYTYTYNYNYTYIYTYTVLHYIIVILYCAILHYTITSCRSPPRRRCRKRCRSSVGRPSCGYPHALWCSDSIGLGVRVVWRLLIRCI